MICLNRIQLLGYVGTAETFSNSNFEVVNFSLATSYKYNRGEESVEETTWFNCAYFNPVQFIKEGLTKGTRVYLDGRMKTEEYEVNGEKRKSWKVIVERLILLPKESNTDLDKRPEQADQPAPGNSQTQTQPPAQQPAGNGSIPGLGSGRKRQNNRAEDYKDYYDSGSKSAPQKDDDLPF